MRRYRDSHKGVITTGIFNRETMILANATELFGVLTLDDVDAVLINDRYV